MLWSVCWHLNLVSVYCEKLGVVVKENFLIELKLLMRVLHGASSRQYFKFPPFQNSSPTSFVSRRSSSQCVAPLYLAAIILWTKL